MSLSPLFRFARFLTLVTLALLLRSTQVGAATPSWIPAFNDKALKNLSDGKNELLVDGEIRLQRIEFQAADGSIADGDSKLVRSELKDHQLLQTYSWGTLSCNYSWETSKFSLHLKVQNDSDAQLEGLTLQLMEFEFPKPPKDWAPHAIYMGHGIGEPTINLAQYGSATVAACNEDVSQPLLFGFPGRESVTRRPLVLSTSPRESYNHLLDPYLKRPIRAGGSDQFSISLRLGGPDATVETLAPDLLKKFQKAFPSSLTWPDRRAIGTLHLSTSEKEYHSPQNPRGWFNDGKGVDISTEAGRTEFRNRLLAYADSSIQVLKKMNAQGMIVWDIEGQEFPHATSYLGDPRSLPPEMEPIADLFFEKFKAAGLRTGICIRPQIPIRSAYREGVQQIEAADPIQTLNDKISYAKKRWGATLFYVDSNGDPNAPLPAQVFQAVAKSNPDVLLIPEHENARYYSYTAPYHELRGEKMGTPDLVREINLGSFSAIYVPDGDVDKHRSELLDSVRHGDILLFRAWWDDPYNAQVKSLYDEASALPPAKPATSAVH